MQSGEQLKSRPQEDAENSQGATVEVTLQEVQRWRAQLVRGLLVAAAIVGPLALAFSAYGVYLRGYFALVVSYSVAYLLVLVLVFWRKVPYALQVGGILLLLYMLGLADLLVFGWKEDARLFFMALALLTSLFYGVPQGFVALALSSLTLLTVGMLGVMGVWPLPPLSDPMFIGPVPISLVSDIASLALLSTMLIVIQRYLVPRFTAAMTAVRERAAAVEREQVEVNARSQNLQQVNYALQRRVFLLEGTLDFASETSSLLDLAPLLSRAVEACARIFELYHVGLYLPDEEGQALILRASSSEAGRRLMQEAFRMPVRGTLLGEVWQQGRSRIFAARDPLEPWRLREARSMALLPLRHGERTLGVLDLQSLEADFFDVDELQVLDLAAGLLATALANVSRVHDQAALLEATSPFYRLMQRFAQARTEEEVYAAILETVQETFPHRAFLLIPTEDGAYATLTAELRGEHLRFPDLQFPWARWFAEEALIPGALQAEKPLLVTDVAAPEALGLETDDLNALARLATQGQLRSLAWVSFHEEGRMLGILGVLFNTLHPFGPTEALLYEQLMELASAALQRLRMVRSARQRMEMEQQLRGFSDQLADIFDLPMLASKAARALQALVDVDGVLVNLTPPAAPVEEEL